MRVRVTGRPGLAINLTPRHQDPGHDTNRSLACASGPPDYTPCQHPTIDFDLVLI